MKPYMQSSTVGHKYWVDSAKGIGVILVVVGHLLYNSDLPLLNKLIYSFHVPLFFILSGYVQKEISGVNYLKRRARKLLVPFFLYTIIGLPIWGYLIIKHGGTIVDVFTDAFYVNGVISNNPLWFLIVLFEISFIIFAFDVPRRNLLTQLMIYILAVLFSYFLYTADIELCNIFGINRAIVCLAFYMFGILLARVDEKAFSGPVLFLALALNLIFGGGV